MNAIRLLGFFVIILLDCFQTVCANSHDQKIKAHSVVVISKDWDLNGKSVLLPEGVTLKFMNAKIHNGKLQGNHTKITGNVDAIFDKVEISGTWNVPVVSTNMFVDLDYDNSLRDVLALTDSKIHNKVTIEKGDYFFNLNDFEKIGVVVTSDTDLAINGNLKLKHNSLRGYDLVRVTGTNITLTGDGSIIGDLSTHIDKGGEWGMGIYLKDATDVFISGITIKECWGDCIYIGGNSQNIIVDGCFLAYGRRQGVSITLGSNILLKDLTITNVGGTSPEYGIDIEPNANGIVEDVFISNVFIENCKGGILVYGGAKGAHVGKVVIEDSKIYNSSKIPINVIKCETVQIVGNTLINNK